MPGSTDSRAPAKIPEGRIGPVEERELPPAPSLRKMIGPGVVLVGVGIASGEYILGNLLERLHR